MTVASKQLVDPAVTSYYHCISRCVRRAFLCGEGCEHRKQWIENRLRELADIFAVGVCAYAVMDNHLHVVLQLSEELANSWSDEQVVRRWRRLFPPRGKDRQPLEVSEQWVRQQAEQPQRLPPDVLRLNEVPSSRRRPRFAAIAGNNCAAGLRPAPDEANESRYRSPASDLSSFCATEQRFFRRVSQQIVSGPQI